MMEIHRESLEEASTHVGGEARMLLPGVQTILGFQLMAVFNQRFELFTHHEQVLHFAAFLLVALTMGLLMAPAAFHRQAEPRTVTDRFVRLSSMLLTISMVPFTAGVCLDTYLIGRMILQHAGFALLAAAAMLLVLAALWFVLPLVAGRPRRC
jgi:Family of unknown function (DUF6328)